MTSHVNMSRNEGGLLRDSIVEGKDPESADRLEEKESDEGEGEKGCEEGSFDVVDSEKGKCLDGALALEFHQFLCEFSPAVPIKALKGVLLVPFDERLVHLFKL